MHKLQIKQKYVEGNGSLFRIDYHNFLVFTRNLILRFFFDILRFSTKSISEQCGALIGDKED